MKGLSEESALNQPPEDPRMHRSSMSEMPGGQMGYGVQPSDESGAEMPPTDGMTAMRHGGRVRERHRGRRHED